jgi:L-xylulose reductase
MTIDQDFNGKQVIVTGAAKGIGRAVAELLASRGAHIVGVGRSQADLDRLRETTGASIITADLGNAVEAREAAIRAASADLLVNCAGTTALDRFIDLPIETFDHIMSVNTRAALIMAQEYARDRIARGLAGSIVNVSSISSTVGFAEHCAYCASKGALDAMTRVMANELGPSGIRVNAINPIVTMTAMAAKAWSDPAKAEPVLGRIPIGRFIEPGEVAETIAFLLSERSAGVNGVCLLVDGGFSIR